MGCNPHNNLVRLLLFCFYCHCPVLIIKKMRLRGGGLPEFMEKGGNCVDPLLPPAILLTLKGEQLTKVDVVEGNGLSRSPPHSSPSGVQTQGRGWEMQPLRKAGSFLKQQTALSCSVRQNYISLCAYGSHSHAYLIMT